MAAEPDARRPTHRRVQIHFDKMLTTEPYHTNCCTPYHWCGCLSVSGQVMAVAPMQCMANTTCQVVLCQCVPGAELCGIFQFFGGMDDADAVANTIKAARNDFAKAQGPHRRGAGLGAPAAWPRCATHTPPWPRGGGAGGAVAQPLSVSRHALFRRRQSCQPLISDAMRRQQIYGLTWLYPPPHSHLSLVS